MALRALFAALLLTAVRAAAQDRPAFEVASVKPGDGSSSDFRIYPGGRLRMTNLELDLIIREAYGIKRFQLTGGPAWIHTDRFSIDAKASGEPTRAEVLAMLQTLLAERFQLKVRRETREENLFVLTVAKGGPKLSKSTANDSYIRLYRNTPSDQEGVDYTIGAQKATIAQLADSLAGMHLQRPVQDRTGIHGEYDFKLRYATNDNPETGPSLFTAIQEQLGLKLETTKGPVEILVVEKAEKPSGN